MPKIKAIVTGGGGFIGSHMVDRLLEDGCEVIVIDNFSTGRLENLAHHHGNKNLHIVQADVCDTKKISRYFDHADWVFHFAALADIVPSIQYPEKYFRSNVDGTFSIIKLCRENRIKKVVYAASSSCYGIPNAHPTLESSDIRTEYPYALTKYIGEQIVLHWGRVYNLPVISLRFFNVYGPRSRTSGTYGAVFGVFLSQKLKGIPYTVVGDGNQTRDFTFVTDVVAACKMAAMSNVKNEIMNVGSGGTYSINYLVELLSGNENNIIHIPKRPGEPDCTYADISKIKSVLNWTPKISFEEGIKIMLDNIDYWREAPIWTPDSIAQATEDWFKYLGK